MILEYLRQYVFDVVMTQAPPNTPVIFPASQDSLISPLDIGEKLIEATKMQSTYFRVSQTVQKKTDRDQAYRSQRANKERCDNTELYIFKNN